MTQSQLTENAIYSMNNAITNGDYKNVKFLHNYYNDKRIITPNSAFIAFQNDDHKIIQYIFNNAGGIPLFCDVFEIAFKKKCNTILENMCAEKYLGNTTTFKYVVQNGYYNIVKYFIGTGFHEGLSIVPILLIQMFL